jgi:hypothetical protein
MRAALVAVALRFESSAYEKPLEVAGCGKSAILCGDGSVGSNDLD